MQHSFPKENLAELKLYMRIVMEFEVLFKNLAEQYCDGRVVDLYFAVKNQINKLIKNDNDADALYKFFDIDKQNKNAKQILIKKAIKLVEGLCL